MSGELEKKKVKNNKKPKKVRKAIPKKIADDVKVKDELLTGGYKYKPDDDEALIVDIPSKPVAKKEQLNEEKKEVKINTITKKVQKTITKKIVDNVKVKNELLTGGYKYKPVDNEVLIVDIPSKPLVKKKQLNEETKKGIKVLIPSVTPVQTNGQIYDAYIKELKNFKLIYNGDIIYDTTLSKTSNNLTFDSDYFVLFGKKYSYNGLRVQKI
jgi:hypothetical protein